MSTKKSVLIVDDEPLMLDLAGKAFELKGYLPITAENGRTAIRILDTQTPDLALIDVVMPGMSGIDLLAFMRTNINTAKIPIYIFSNYPYKDKVVQSAELGVTGFISKRELDIQKFLQKIDKISQSIAAQNKDVEAKD